MALLCIALLAWGTHARAAVQLQAKALSLPGISLQQVQMRLDSDAQGRMHLQFSAARADVASLGWRHVGIDLDGALTRGVRRQWQFDGAIKLRDAPGGLLGNGHLRLTMDIDANNLEVALSQGSASATAALPLDQPTHAQIHLDKLPMAWLQGLLAKVWSGHVTGGHISGSLALDVIDGGIRSSGELSVSGAGFDSPDGTLAGQGLAARGRLALDTSDGHSKADVDLNLHGGQLLLGPLYASLPKHDVHLSMSARAHKGGVSLQNLRFTDPDAMHLSGSVDMAADGSLSGLDLTHFSVSLPAAYQRYGKAWLATLGFADLHTQGFVQGSLALAADGLRTFAFDARGVNIADANGRFAIAGLHGGLDWQRDSDRTPTTLAWSSLDFYKIATGAAAAHWQSQGGALQLQAPLDVPVLGGHLLVNSLSWRPAAKRGQRLQTALAVTGVDVAALSHAFGWPQFSGTLAGAIPALRYVDDHVEFDGGLSLNVFGGFIDVTRLTLQHPFSAAPVLAADISLRQLDLAAITGVFDIGKITGRMDGSVDDLRMVDWSPVAFKASLLAGSGGRISQRAVNSLTAVGGGGIAAGLQGAVLKLFSSFGYSRIGLNCTLQGSVCHMSGLQPAGDGYLIVDGSGLPHLSVIGHQHEVSWPTLIARLSAAIKGNGPVVK